LDTSDSLQRLPDDVPGADPTNLFSPRQTIGTSPKGTLGDSPKTGRTSLLNPFGSRNGGGSSPGFDADPAHDLAGAATLTGTSSVGGRKKGDPAMTATLVVGIVGVTLGLAGWMIGRAGRRLRKPSKDQIHQFAEPVGRIIARRTDLSWMGDDLADVTAAGVVFGDWVGDGPLTEPAAPDVVQTGYVPPEDPTAGGDVSRETATQRLAADATDYDAVGLPPRDPTARVTYLS